MMRPIDVNAYDPDRLCFNNPRWNNSPPVFCTYDCPFYKLAISSDCCECQGDENSRIDIPRDMCLRYNSRFAVIDPKRRKHIDRLPESLKEYARELVSKGQIVLETEGVSTHDHRS